MKQNHLFIPGCLFAVTGLAVTHTGGVDGGLLFAIYLVILAGLTYLGTAPWMAGLRRSSDAANRRPAATWLLLAFFTAAVFISAARSPMPGTALELALRLALLPLAFLFTRTALRAGFSWPSLWGPVETVGILLAVGAILERLLTGDRAYTVMSDPNVLAGLFNVFLIVEFVRTASVWQKRGQFSRRGGSLVVLFTVAIGVTGSLSGLLSLTAVLFVATLLVSERRARRKGAAIALAAVAVIALTLICSRGTAETPAGKLEGLAHHSSFTVRIEMAQAALAIYRDHGWMGTGLGSFKVFYPHYRGPLDTGSAGELAHNDYVQFLQEGGPLLLGALLLFAAMILVQLWRVVRSGSEPTTAVADAGTGLGLSLAAGSFMLQAGMNFVFYVAACTWIFGFLLAGLIPMHAVNDAPRPSSGQRLIFGTLMIGAVFMLSATLGARAVYERISSSSCEWHACDVLRANTGFKKELTAFLIGTQPTWLPARAFLVRDYLKEEQVTPSPIAKLKAQQLAARELGKMINDVPELFTARVELADLLGRNSDVAAELPDGVPRDRIQLYRQALDADPTNLFTRMKLTAQLEQRQDKQGAFDVLVVAGTPYWQQGLWGDAGRLQFLTAAIPLALDLHRCSTAKEFAEGLRVFVEIGQKMTDDDKPLLLAPSQTLPPSALSEAQQAIEHTEHCS